jgi:hypothetical protein
MGLDCIFHLRGTPYSRWTFSRPLFFATRRVRVTVRLVSCDATKKNRGCGSLAAGHPILRNFFHPLDSGHTVRADLHYLTRRCYVMLCYVTRSVGVNAHVLVSFEPCLASWALRAFPNSLTISAAHGLARRSNVRASYPVLSRPRAKPTRSHAPDCWALFNG